MNGREGADEGRKQALETGAENRCWKQGGEKEAVKKRR
jgi:hypothetical protein